MINDCTSWNIELIDVNDKYAIGFWGDIFINIWMNEATVDSVNDMMKELRRYAANRSSGFATFTIVQKSAGRPSVEVRRLISETMSETNILFSAALLQGESFFAASARAIMASIMMSVMSSYPHKIFSDFRNCCKWFVDTSEKRAGNWALCTASLKSAVTEFVRKVQEIQGILLTEEGAGGQTPLDYSRAQQDGHFAAQI